MSRTILLCALLGSSAACSEYEFLNDEAVDEPVDDEPIDEVGDTAEPDDEPDEPDHFDRQPDPLDVPDQFVPEDCPGGTFATWQGGEIWVASWGNTSASGTFQSPVDGWFHAYSTTIAESGSGQWNESSTFRVTNSTWPSGEPFLSNCGDDWVVTDTDNYSPPSGSRLYIGTFWMDAGDNDLHMDHYCPQYRVGACPGHHFTDDAGSTCDTSNVNSVHFEGDAICLMRAVPGP